MEHDAERGMERAQAKPYEVIAEMLDARLMTYRRVWICGAGVGLGWVFPA
jgi:hypothetical protein